MNTCIFVELFHSQVQNYACLIWLIAINRYYISNNEYSLKQYDNLIERLTLSLELILAHGLEFNCFK